MLTLPSYAKVNLTLEVLGKRDDGYHEISSVLQTIDLADLLSFEPATGIRFVCCDPGTGQTASFEEMALKAASLLLGEAACSKGAVIRAESVRIPRAVGLGSSAGIPATVLKGLNELWSLGLSLEGLSRLAARLGSDTPFFIYGGTALAEGRGERITPLPPPLPTWLVLLKPEMEPLPSKTAAMYSLLDSSHFTTGTATRRLVSELRQGRPLQSSLLWNTFEGVAFDFFPQLGEYRRRFLAAGAGSVHLVGAGPMLFTLVPGRTEGEGLAKRLKDEGLGALLVQTTRGSKFRGSRVPLKGHPEGLVNDELSSPEGD
ncbi:4-(cytidine 5'-diphospho)-2-C-methyl-D-erythritol kinase [Dehalococcoidia bacterium]|nr:4-(cytidine 5'-diphospho)-2-C-methyl-D-erythritol kinase [Dehalococcoidia bacterium]